MWIPTPVDAVGTARTRSRSCAADARNEDRAQAETRRKIIAGAIIRTVQRSTSPECAEIPDRHRPRWLEEQIQALKRSDDRALFGLDVEPPADVDTDKAETAAAPIGAMLDRVNAQTAPMNDAPLDVPPREEWPVELFLGGRQATRIVALHLETTHERPAGSGFGGKGRGGYNVDRLRTPVRSAPGVRSGRADPTTGLLP